MRATYGRARLWSAGLASAGLLMGMPEPYAYAETVPTAGTVDSRIRTAVYNADEVYRLQARIGYQIDIEFARDETFVGLGAGDLQGLTFTGQANHLFLKPKAAHVSTNLTVLTTRRGYHFDYTAAAPTAETDVSQILYSLRFVYPQPVHSEGPASAADIDTLLRSGSESSPPNRDYWYCGHPSLKPVSVSDDGVHTRVRFGAHSEFPAVFVRNDDGSESLLNFNIEEGDLVIHRVARRFIVRRGKLTGCIVNRGYDGSGLRVKSGTVSPSVERATRGDR